MACLLGIWDVTKNIYIKWKYKLIYNLCENLRTNVSSNHKKLTNEIYVTLATKQKK